MQQVEQQNVTYLSRISLKVNRYVRASGISCVRDCMVNWILWDSENKSALQKAQQQNRQMHHYLKKEI
jgi:hypothetical protein